MNTEVKPVRRRRRWGRWTLSIIGVLLLGSVGAGAIYFMQARVNTVGSIDFDTELAIPPLAESEVDPSGTRVFDLDIESGQTLFLDGDPTETWGINGTYLGPTIRAQRGEKVGFPPNTESMTFR